MPTDTMLRAPAIPHTHRRRLLEGVAFVAVWIGLGALLPVDSIGYLLLGIPLTVGFQLVARRRPLRELLARDGTTFALDRKGKAAVAMGLVLPPAFLGLQAAIPTDEWLDSSWAALAMATAIIAAYAIFRRVFVAYVVATLVVGAALGAQAPRLATERSGDRQVLASLDSHGSLEGYQDLSIAVVDLHSSQQVRFANIGSSKTMRFEVGSVTKALTGLVIADAVRRGEVNLASPVSTYLPSLRGSAAGDVTMQELSTHHSGYAHVGGATFRQAIWSGPLGRNFFAADLEETMQEIRGADLTSRGTYLYSNLGAAAAGQAAAAAAGMSYANLMRTRLFEPMHMTDTDIQTTQLVTGGKAASGLHVQPWVFDGYAPAGATVTTSKDLSILATAVLERTAPGLDALTGNTATDSANTRVGIFWGTSRFDDGQVITGHSGMTGGYSSYLGLDLLNKKAVIVLSDVAKSVDEIGMHLLSHGS